MNGKICQGNYILCKVAYLDKRECLIASEGVQMV